METESNSIATSVCTYNILADRYALSKTFEYCDRKFLHWKSHRRNLILSELSALHCDIIFLQEVDRINDFQNYLQGQNYFTIYYKRPNRKFDGCLIAWKKSKFELCSPVYIANYNDLCVDKANYNRFRKDNIGMIIILKSMKNPKLKVIAANTHLYWNPNMKDVKLLQTSSFLNSIQWVINTHKLHKENYKIIIGGDFNSKPMSNVYKFVIDGFINININNNESAECEAKTNDNIQLNNDNMKIKNSNILRIICDRDLRKTAQWLALMEIDSAYFSGNSTKNYTKLFSIAKRENRIIITRNTQIISRSECPKFLLIGARETQRQAYKHVVNYFGIKVDFKQKQCRENILNCLKCPKCLESLKQTTLTDIKHLLTNDRNPYLLEGKTCKGIPLEFYQCVSKECAHLAYHRQGWLDRLHCRRQQHYNGTVTTIATKKNSNNKYKTTAQILKDHIYRKRRPIIIGIEIMEGSLKKYDRMFAIKKDVDNDENNILDLGLLSEMECDNKKILVAKKGDKVCIKLETEHSYGRQFDDTYLLVVQSRNALRKTHKGIGDMNVYNIPIQTIPNNVYPHLKVNKLKHCFKLKSVYCEKNGNEPITTNHTKGFSGCLDYLFVCNNITIKQCDKLPEPAAIDGIHNKCLSNYLPDRYHPSDHLPIKAILIL